MLEHIHDLLFLDADLFGFKVLYFVGVLNQLIADIVFLDFLDGQMFSGPESVDRNRKV